MTNIQINIALAAWLSERTGEKTLVSDDALIIYNTDGAYPEQWIHFTDALDSMRLVEDAMTRDELLAYAAAAEEEQEYWYLSPGSRVELMRTPPRVRARCAVKALGLEVDTSQTPSN